MAQTRVIADWRPLRFLPFIERRTLGAFFDRAPTVLVDSSLIWNEYRIRPTQPQETPHDD